MINSVHVYQFCVFFVSCKVLFIICSMLKSHARVIVVGLFWSVCRLVCWSVCPEVFSRTVAVVDTKRGYVGMCDGRSAQQESGAASSKNSMFTARALNYIQLLC